MTESAEAIRACIEAQRGFFRTGKTLELSFRIEALKKLRRAVEDHAEALEEALRADLGRSGVESWLCDLGPTIAEINETIHGLRRWARPEKHLSGITCFPGIFTTVYKQPYGTALIISPFNFPVVLTLGVLTACISGGNTAVIKASSKSPASTRALQRLIADVFPPEYVTVLGGGHEVADLLLAERFDKIFYTGSPAVGKHVMEAAAKNLTPVAMELGGENGNWCVVRKDADLRDAARKIAFFKLLNAGQICINVNQVAVAREVAEEFLAALKEEFTRQIGPEPLLSGEYPSLINDAAYEKCARTSEAYRERIVFGGRGDPASRRFEPTILYPVSAEEEIVQRELFCPILPVVPYEDARIDELARLISLREHPLALYVFTRDVRWAKKFMRTQQYGGGCINEVCLHMMAKGVPFNGVGHSGMGAYHGEWGFREFTHPSSVLRGSRHLNLPLREHPYTGKNEDRKRKALKRFER